MSENEHRDGVSELPSRHEVGLIVEEMWLRNRVTGEAVVVRRAAALGDAISRVVTARVSVETRRNGSRRSLLLQTLSGEAFLRILRALERRFSPRSVDSAGDENSSQDLEPTAARPARREIV